MSDGFTYSIEHENGKRRAELTNEQGKLLFTMACCAQEKRHGPVEAHLLIRVPVRRDAILQAAKAGLLHDVRGVA